MLKVLLVDDEKFAIEGLTSMLDWKRFSGELIGTAASGEEAVRLMESVRPDVVVCDIKMGGMDGIELAGIIHEKQENTLVILLTAHGEFEYARKAIRYGVTDYILKPITREKVAQLNELLYQKRQQQIRQKESYLAVWDAKFRQKLLDALKNDDRDVLDNFFQSVLFRDLMNGENRNAVGIQLINYLYSYLQDMNLEQKAIAYSRNETMENFLDITGCQEKMDYIITKYYDLLIAVTQQKNAHADAIAAYAFRYIGEHFAEPDFNLSGLSYAMHVSLSHLSTVFKQTTGNNLSAYVTEMRLERAKELLADMRYSISDISGAAGYSDAKYFAKLFKKKTGSTPSEYRNFIVQGGGNGNQK